MSNPFLQKPLRSTGISLTNENNYASQQEQERINALKEQNERKKNTYNERQNDNPKLASITAKILEEEEEALNEFEENKKYTEELKRRQRMNDFLKINNQNKALASPALRPPPVSAPATRPRPVPVSRPTPGQGFSGVSNMGPGVDVVGDGSCVGDMCQIFGGVKRANKKSRKSKKTRNSRKTKKTRKSRKTKKTRYSSKK